MKGIEPLLKYPRFTVVMPMCHPQHSGLHSRCEQKQPCKTVATSPHSSLHLAVLVQRNLTVVPSLIPLSLVGVHHLGSGLGQRVTFSLLDNVVVLLGNFSKADAADLATRVQQVKVENTACSAVLVVVPQLGLHRAPSLDGPGVLVSSNLADLREAVSIGILHYRTPLHIVLRCHRLRPSTLHNEGHIYHSAK